MRAARMRSEVLARQVKSFASALPVTLEERLRATPYRALGIACVVGVGVGIVFGSRILRTALSSAASLVIVELGRHYLLQDAKQGLGSAC
jgi:hypothetical protein